MKRRDWVFFGVLFLTLGMIAGCRSTAEPEKFTIRPAAEMPTMDLLGKQYGTEMLEAFRSGDYAKFVAPLEERLAKKTSEKNFAEVRAQMLRVMGTPEKFEYLTELDQTMAREYLWKVTFVKTSKGPDGGDVRTVRTALFKLSLYLLNGKPAIGKFLFI